LSFYVWLRLWLIRLPWNPSVSLCVFVRRWQPQEDCNLGCENNSSKILCTRILFYYSNFVKHFRIIKIKPMKILVCISHVPTSKKLILPMVIQNLTPTVCNTWLIQMTNGLTRAGSNNKEQLLLLMTDIKKSGDWRKRPFCQRKSNRWFFLLRQLAE
jgi:hypothetical protein